MSDGGTPNFARKENIWKHMKGIRNDVERVDSARRQKTTTSKASSLFKPPTFADSVEAPLKNSGKKEKEEDSSFVTMTSDTSEFTEDYDDN